MKTPDLIFHLDNQPKKFNQNNIQSFHVQGIDNKIVKDKLLSLLKIRHFASDTPKITRANIEKIIHTLQQSGFFISIKLISISKKNYKYFIIYCRINPLLKRIRILKLYNLQISRDYVLSLFSKQVGLPKNLKFINNQLNLIRNWYRSRGFEWVQVKLLEDYKQDSELKIEIVEGKIGSISIICRDSHHESSNYLDHIVVQQLDIQLGSILNKYHLEKKILNLKNKYLFSDCNYRVNWQKDKLHIYITYSRMNSRLVYLFNKTCSIMSNFYKFLEGLSTELVHYNHMFQLGAAKKLHSIKHKVLQSHLHDFNNQISYPSFYVYELGEYCGRASLSFILSHYNSLLGLKSSLNLSDNYTRRLLIDLEIGSSHPIFKVKYYNLSASTGYRLRIRFSQNLLRFHNRIISSYNRIIDFKNLCKNYTLSFVRYHDIKSQINFKDQMILEQHIGQVQYDLSLPFVYINHSFKTVNLIGRYEQLCRIFRDIQCLSQHSTQSYLYLKHRFDYDPYHLIAYFKPGTILSFSSEHMISWSNKQYARSMKKIHGQTYNIYCKYNKIFKMAEDLKILSKNIFLFSLEVRGLIGDMLSLPFSNYNCQSIGIIHHNHNAYHLKSIFYNLRLEGHYPCIYNSSIFLFIEYFNPHNHDTLLKQHIDHTEYNKDLILGFGLQINTPIQKLAPIRVQYGINMHGKTCIQLNLISKLFK